MERVSSRFLIWAGFLSLAHQAAVIYANCVTGDLLLRNLASPYFILIEAPAVLAIGILELYRTRLSVPQWTLGVAIIEVGSPSAPMYPIFPP